MRVLKNFKKKNFRILPYMYSTIYRTKKTVLENFWIKTTQ
jgi:hypothetical protein